VIAPGLICLPSHARDCKNPDIDEYLARYVRGSNDIDYKERIKTMKLLWDAVGTEYGARHELYEKNYSGSHELVRLFLLQLAQARCIRPRSRPTTRRRCRKAGSSPMIFIC